MRTGNKNSQSGAAAVEFALILPVLLAMLFMIIEFSIALYDKAVITNASREGARYGVTNAPAGSRPNVGQITSTVSSYCEKNLISFGPAGASTSVTGACVASGELLTVNVSYTYNYLVLPNFPFLKIGGSGITLTANTVMRCE